jgi:FKBP-type peptidyl-prolyl cis-trans isomerase FkpA
MKTMKSLGVILAAALAGTACAPVPAADRPEDQPEFHRPPANAFEEAFTHEDGVVPIRWGGWRKILTPGTGDSPGIEDKVRVNYRGALTDGTEFDSSFKRGQPSTFSLTSVIPCWTNGMMAMKVGEKSKFVCPAASAYGDAGSPPRIPGGATLVFEVELVGIVK